MNKICQLIERRSKKYPEGKIHVVNSRGRIQYYIKQSQSAAGETYLSKKEEKKISEYLQKKYEEKIYRAVQKEKSNLSHFLSKEKSTSTYLKSLFSNNPEEIKKYLHPFDVSDEDYASEWLNEPYERKEMNSNMPVYVAVNGERVRSKSELNIANTLARMGIPYKYECQLVLSNGQRIHPDFTALNVRTRKIYIWEHRGMMGDADYANHSVQRFKLLEREGYFPGDNLIITEETSLHPLGTDEIEAVIKHYLM